MDVTFENIKNVIIESEIAGDLASLEADTTFESIGVDSLDTFNLLLSVEESFDVKFPEDNVEDFDTIAKLAAFIKSNA